MWLNIAFDYVARGIAALLRRPTQRQISPLGQTITATRVAGRSLLRRIDHVDAHDARALRVLTDEVISWWGEFERTLNDAVPEIFEEFRTQGIPSPVTRDGLRDTVKGDLVVLSQIERRMFWPRRLFQMQRRFSRASR